jgi:hypothetical protein
VTEHLHGPTAPGTVMLDIGPGVGALILAVPAELNGAEIEISQHGSPDAVRTHSQVRERPSATGTVYAAVYPGLPEGQYTIWRDADTVAGTIEVTGGQVATFDWS